MVTKIVRWLWEATQNFRKFYHAFKLLNTPTDYKMFGKSTKKIHLLKMWNMPYCSLNAKDWKHKDIKYHHTLFTSLANFSAFSASVSASASRFRLSANMSEIMAFFFSKLSVSLPAFRRSLSIIFNLALI